MFMILIILGGGAISFIFARRLFMMLFSMQNHETHKERMKQLRKNGTQKTSDEEATAQLVDKITSPIITYIMPKLKPRDTSQLETDLKVAGWDVYFTATQYRAMNFLLKIVGIIAFMVVFPISWVFAFIVMALAAFLMDLLFKNSISERKKKLFNQFPDFIRIIQGYLMANVPLPRAVEDTIPYVGDEWKHILKDFVLTSDIKSVPEAIDNLVAEVDIFEIREFFSLVKLNLEQGINIKDSFESQSVKVAEMQLEVMLSKIGYRQMMAKIIQAPLLLCMFASAGLPTFYSMMTFSTL